MPRFLIFLAVGILLPALLIYLLPVETLILAGIAVIAIAGLVFFLFYLGLQDFQGY
jgi:hypothetical protein